MEQTETPDMLAARNEQRKAQGLKKAREGWGWVGLGWGLWGDPHRSMHIAAGYKHQPINSICNPQPQDMVVRREKVAVLTQGTLTDAEMVAAQPEASYLTALAELPVPGARLCPACCRLR